MKVYISADIEGISGVCDWDQTGKTGYAYEEARSLMTEEVLAACRGAEQAGYSEILIKDAHGSGKNIIPSKLPLNATLIRGWSGHPYGMMQEIDTTCDAAVFIGYHGAAGTSVNPLAHSFSLKVSYIKINGELVSEFTINTMIAHSVNVPVAFVSGDEYICREAKKMNENIVTNGSSRGVGNSSICVAPRAVCRNIEKGVAEVLSSSLSGFLNRIPEHLKLEVRFNTPYDAYDASFYPGMKLVDDVTVSYETDDFFEMIRAKKFII
jgi:D-amino peptidase